MLLLNTIAVGYNRCQLLHRVWTSLNIRKGPVHEKYFHDRWVNGSLSYLKSPPEIEINIIWKSSLKWDLLTMSKFQWSSNNSIFPLQYTWKVSDSFPLKKGTGLYPRSTTRGFSPHSLSNTHVGDGLLLRSRGSPSNQPLCRAGGAYARAHRQHIHRRRAQVLASPLHHAPARSLKAPAILSWIIQCLWRFLVCCLLIKPNSHRAPANYLLVNPDKQSSRNTTPCACGGQITRCVTPFLLVPVPSRRPIQWAITVQSYTG